MRQNYGKLKMPFYAHKSTYEANLTHFYNALIFLSYTILYLQRLEGIRILRVKQLFPHAFQP